MNFLKAIGGFFVNLYKKIVNGGDPTIVQLPSDLAITPALINHCINVVNIIKGIINNPVTVLVTDLTPISLDNDIRIKIADSLPPILAGLTYEKEALANSTDDNDFVNSVLAKVTLSDDPDKNAFYHALAARLIMIVSDGKVTWSEAVSLIELYFKQMFGSSDVDTVTNSIAATASAVSAAQTIGASTTSTVADIVAAAAPVVAGIAPKPAADVAAAAPVVAAIAPIVEAVAPDIADDVKAVDNTVQSIAQAAEPAPAPTPAVEVPNLTQEQLTAVLNKAVTDGLAVLTTPAQA